MNGPRYEEIKSVCLFVVVVVVFVVVVSYCFLFKNNLEGKGCLCYNQMSNEHFFCKTKSYSIVNTFKS